MQAFSPEVDPNLTAVLIGGGSYYASGIGLEENSNILDTALELTGQQRPSVLLVPSARWLKAGPITTAMERFSSYYAGRGVGSTILHEFLYEPHSIKVPSDGDLPLVPSRLPSQDELDERIGKADVIFTFGGDPNHMLKNIWEPLGIDRRIVEATHRGAVLQGSSAGALYPFAHAQSDGSSLKSANDMGFHVTEGLGLISGGVVAAAHYDTTATDNKALLREDEFEQMMYERRGREELGIGIDEYSGLQITPGGVLSVVRDQTDGRRQIHSIHYPSVTGTPVRHHLSPSDGNFGINDLI